MGSILYTKGLTKCPRDYRIESNVKKQRMRNSVFSVIKYSQITNLSIDMRFIFFVIGGCDIESINHLGYK